MTARQNAIWILVAAVLTVLGIFLLAKVFEALGQPGAPVVVEPLEAIPTGEELREVLGGSWVQGSTIVPAANDRYYPTAEDWAIGVYADTAQTAPVKAILYVGVLRFPDVPTLEWFHRRVLGDFPLEEKGTAALPSSAWQLYRLPLYEGRMGYLWVAMYDRYYVYTRNGSDEAAWTAIMLTINKVDCLLSGASQEDCFLSGEGRG